VCAGDGVEVADGFFRMNQQQMPVTILEEVLCRIEDALRTAKFDLGGNRKACLLLFLSAVENARAFVDISQKPYAFASVSNARSALEALVDAVATMRDDTHVKRMHQEFLKNKRNALSSAIKMTQKLDIGEPAALQRQLNSLDLEIELLKADRIPKMRREELISEFLDESGLLSVQWSILCDVSHNNINSLAVRHLNGESAQENIVLYAPLDEKLSEGIVATLASLFVDVASLIYAFVSSGRDEYLANILSARSELHWVPPAS
jgi:hypothetical protein